jgi:hypothetical protein
MCMCKQKGCKTNTRHELTKIQKDLVKSGAVMLSYA